MTDFSQQPPTGEPPSSDLAEPDLTQLNPADLAIYDQQLESDKKAAARKRDAAIAAAENACKDAEAAWQEAQRTHATDVQAAMDAKDAAYDAAAVEFVTAKKDLGKPGCEPQHKLRVLQEQQLLAQRQADLAEVQALATAAAAKDTAEAVWKAAATTLEYAKRTAEAEYAVDVKTAETEYYQKISKALG